MLSENILRKELIPDYSDRVLKLAEETFHKLDGFTLHESLLVLHKLDRLILKESTISHKSRV
jgi:hypothetical protein